RKPSSSSAPTGWPRPRDEPRIDVELRRFLSEGYKLKENYPAPKSRGLACLCRHGRPSCRPSTAREHRTKAWMRGTSPRMTTDALFQKVPTASAAVDHRPTARLVPSGPMLSAGAAACSAGRPL